MMIVEFFIDLQPDSLSEALWTFLAVALVFMVILAGGRDIAGSFLERLKRPLLGLFVLAVVVWVSDARRAGTEGILINGDAITVLENPPAAGSPGQADAGDSFSSPNSLAPPTTAPGSFSHHHDGFTHSHD